MEKAANIYQDVELDNRLSFRSHIHKMMTKDIMTCCMHHLWLQNGINEYGTGSGQSTTNRSFSGGGKGTLH